MFGGARVLVLDFGRRSSYFGGLDSEMLDDGAGLAATCGYHPKTFLEVGSIVPPSPLKLSLPPALGLV